MFIKRWLKKWLEVPTSSYLYDMFQEEKKKLLCELDKTVRHLITGPAQGEEIDWQTHMRSLYWQEKTNSRIETYLERVYKEAIKRRVDELIRGEELIDEIVSRINRKQVRKEK